MHRSLDHLVFFLPHHAVVARRASDVAAAHGRKLGCLPLILCQVKELATIVAFSLISEGLPTGAMTDGAKRRDDTSPVEIISKKYGLSTGAAPVSSHDLPPVALGGYTVPMPTLDPKPLEVDGVQLHLPPQVPDLATWGRTIITWGKYKSEGITYAELYERQDERARTYKSWCKGRVKTAEGLLLDLTRFLLMCDHISKGPALEQGPIIPGTSEVRRYK